VLAAGIEKMNDGADVTNVLATAADQELEVYYGVTFPGLYAMIARAHMQRHGTTEEDLAWVAVKNHRHGAMNEKAQFRREVTPEQVMASSLVSEPLRLLHCSPVTDGAAAVLLCPLDMAREFTDRPVKIVATGLASDSMALADRDDPAFLCCIEALGFVEEGKGGPAARDGITAIGGQIPVNTSGGLKSKGHPVGATGIAQTIEIFRQLRGEAGQRQVENARVGLAQNMGGSGASSVVHIFEGV
jgi:acetyl-CoA C-acetyltransferase